METLHLSIEDFDFDIVVENAAWSVLFIDIMRYIQMYDILTKSNATIINSNKKKERKQLSIIEEYINYFPSKTYMIYPLQFHIDNDI